MRKNMFYAGLVILLLALTGALYSLNQALNTTSTAPSNAPETISASAPPAAIQEAPAAQSGASTPLATPASNNSSSSSSEAGTDAPVTPPSPGASGSAPSAAVPPAANVITFDFDPASTGQGTPLDQASGGVTARFFSPYDPGIFSVQNQGTTSYALSRFSGNYLASNSASDYLYINFSRMLTSIRLAFATAGGQADMPGSVIFTIYRDSVLIGSVTEQGSPIEGDSYPQGTLSYNGRQFNMVRIAMPSQPGKRFLVDNIEVTLGG